MKMNSEKTQVGVKDIINDPKTVTMCGNYKQSKLRRTKQ
jgi:hypothetical protein